LVYLHSHQVSARASANNISNTANVVKPNATRLNNEIHGVKKPLFRIAHIGCVLS